MKYCLVVGVRSSDVAVKLPEDVKEVALETRTLVTVAKTVEVLLNSSMCATAEVTVGQRVVAAAKFFSQLQVRGTAEVTVAQRVV